MQVPGNGFQIQIEVRKKIGAHNRKGGRGEVPSKAAEQRTTRIRTEGAATQKTDKERALRTGKRACEPVTCKTAE